MAINTVELHLKHKKRHSLCFDGELNDKLNYVSKMTGKSKVDLLRCLIEPNFSIAATFESGNFWLFQSGSTITIQWHGNSRMLNGKNTYIDDDDDLDSVIAKKFLVKQSKQKQVIEEKAIAA